MPRLNLQELINHLEEVDMNLGLIWGECKNYDLLEAIEKERKHIRKIIETVWNLMEMEKK